MNVSGEWVAALALNAVRHRMGSRHAIKTVIARWMLRHRGENAPQGEREKPIGIAISPTISPNAAVTTTASMPV